MCFRNIKLRRVYAPNDEIYGKFHVLLPVNEKTKRTLFELKQIYSGRWDVNERTKERIPSLPEDYLVSKEAEEILQMVDKTPARLFSADRRCRYWKDNGCQNDRPDIRASILCVHLWTWNG